MTRCHTLAALTILLLVDGILPTPGRAQDNDPPPVPPPTPTPQSLASIADGAEELQELRRDISQQLADTSDLDAIDSLLDDIEASDLPLLETQAADLQSEARLSDLLDVDTSARRLDDELTQTISTLESEVRQAEKDIATLRELDQRWSALTATMIEHEAPNLLLNRAEQASQLIAELARSVSSRRNRALELLDRSLESEIRLSDLRERLGREIDRLQRGTLASASQPLWRIGLQSPQDAAEVLRHTAAGDLSRTLDYALTAGIRILLVLTIALAIGIAITLLVRRRLEDQATAEEPAELSPVLAHPVSASLLLALVAARLLAPQGPQIVDHLFWAMTALPAAHLASTILGRPSRMPIALITATILLWPFRAYVEAVPVLDRLLLLAEVAAAMVAVTLILRRGLVLDRLTGGWHAAVRTLLWIEMVVLGVSFVAGVVGEVGLARLLRDGAVVSLGLAMVLYGTARALLRIVIDVLRGPVGGRIRMIREHPAGAVMAVRRTVTAAAVAAWSWLSLAAFQLTRSFATAVSDILAAGVEIGWFAVTVGEILAFFGAIAAAFLIAKVMCFFLDEEFLPRLPLGRGVAYMISTSVRYLILLAGFVVALAALGVDLTKATLLAGAFGVGLGFGLQNVVNNFVSGLILLFERPIRVGDVIGVSGTVGEVTRIGIRSSTVKTFLGSEVLVPNGDLISKDVTNWTLSNRRRLVEVLVGAAYGSDAQTVIDILETVAGTHEKILAEPPPTAYLVGFGDSQLDFRLVCWVAQYGDGYQTASELRVAVAEAFEEAGIEIPFPQQDLHVRTGEEPIVAQAPRVAENDDANGRAR